MTEEIDFRIGFLKKKNRQLAGKRERIRQEILMNNVKIWRLEKMKREGESNENKFQNV